MFKSGYLLSYHVSTILGIFFLWQTGLAVTGPGITSVTLYEDGVAKTLPVAFSLPTSRPALIEQLSKDYAERGFFNASIDSIQSKEETGSATVHVTPGCPFYIGSLTYQFPEEESDLFSQIPLFYGVGDRYDARLLHGEMQRRVRYLELEGYVLASLEIQSFELEYELCQVRLVVDVVPGDLYTVDHIIIEGVQTYSPSYLETATGIRQGDPVTPELFNRGRRNLENTNFFRSVSEGDLRFMNEGTAVYYEVDERRANEFDLMFGYAPVPPSGSELIGRGFMLLRNTGWAGSTLKLLFERLDTYVTRFETGFDREWIGGRPLGAGVHFSFFQQDTVYQTIGLEAYSSYNWTPARKLSLHLKQKHTDTGREQSGYTMVLEGYTRSIGVGFDYDNRDSRLNPLRGYLFSLYVETGYRKITDSRIDALGWNDMMAQQRFQTSFQGWYSPYNRQVVALRLFGSLVESPYYMETDLFRLGGTTSIRGYREDQFRVSRTAWGDLEYRYLLDPYSHGFLFFGGGLYQRPEMEAIQVRGHSEWLYAGGFGFRYQTPIGLIAFTYAVSAEDPLHNGKVHVGVKAAF